MTALLTPAELDQLCAGLTQPAARCRYLRSQGFAVKVAPNGQPIVSRANFEAVMAGRKTDQGSRSEPSVANVLSMFQRAPMGAK